MTAVSAATVNVSTFVEVLKRSQLIEAKRLEHSLKSVALTSGQDRTAADVAQQLIVAGLITKWQAAQLLKGKYRGFTLGKYVIRRPLGKGGMGIVYEAEHAVLNSRVAIKILPKARNAVEKSVSRFLAEARAAAKLNHPNIVRVHDCDVIDDRRFMVMDLVDGSNLGEIVEQHGGLSYRNAILMLKQAALGLAHAHENGVTHRDVKPNNFLIERGGQLKVADMGLALFEIDEPDRHTHDGPSSIVGTVDYVAPEQAWDSRKVDRRADMYSLGCTLYFMIAGRPPFDQGTLAQRLAKHQTAMPTPLMQMRADCPVAIWNLCQKMMAKKPQDRLQNMSDVVRVCDQLLPKLTGGRNMAALAERGLLTTSDSSLSGQSDGWNSGDLLGLQGISMDTSLESESAFDTLPDFSGSSSHGSGDSFSGFATAEQASDHASGQAFWGQSPMPVTGTAPAKRKTVKGSSGGGGDSELPYAKVAVLVGLFLALAGLGISIATALNTDDAAQGFKPPIKQIETRDGGQVIIVDQKN